MPTQAQLHRSVVRPSERLVGRPLPGVHRRTLQTDQGRLVIEPAWPTDAAEILALYQEVLAEDRFFITSAEEYTGTREWLSEVIREASRRSNSTFLVARLGGRLVGALTVAGGNLRRTQHVGRMEIYVANDLRGIGLGRGLLEATVDWAHAQPRLAKLSLVVFEDNERAVRLYQAAGFEIEGRRVGEYREPDGHMRNDLMMFLDVSEPPKSDGLSLSALSVGSLD